MPLDRQAGFPHARSKMDFPEFLPKMRGPKEKQNGRACTIPVAGMPTWQICSVLCSLRRASFFNRHSAICVSLPSARHYDLCAHSRTFQALPQNLQLLSEDGKQRSENRGQRTENRVQMSDNRGQRTDNRGQMSDIGILEWEGGLRAYAPAERLEGWKKDVRLYFFSIYLFNPVS